MKQGQYVTTRWPKPRGHQPGGLSEALCYPAYAPRTPVPAGPGLGHRAGHLIGGLVRLIWLVVTLPFRLLAAVLGLIGRAFGIMLGFTIMVVGMALWAGPLAILGIPLFLIGLLLTLRCLG